MRQYKKWIEGDLNFIKKNINKLNNIELGEALGRNRFDIHNVTSVYKIKRDKEIIKKFRIELNKKREGKEKRKKPIRYKKVLCQYPELGYCWICTSHSKDNAGYVYIRRNKKNYVMHRYTYEKKYGFIPEGLFVCHKCDNPSCINPDHLFVGSKRDNAIDMVQKERGGNQFKKGTFPEGTVRVHGGCKHIKKNGKWVYIKKLIEVYKCHF